MVDRPKIHCAVSGRELELTPEEEVRQLLALRLLGLGYRRDDLRVNYTARFGSQAKYLDIGVLRAGGDGEDRFLQQNILMIAECKRRGISAKGFEDARAQLESYLSACPNAMFGIVTDGARTSVIRKSCQRTDDGLCGPWEFVEGGDIPGPEQAEEYLLKFASSPMGNDGPDVRVPSPAHEPIRFIATVAPDGNVHLPEGTYLVANEYRHANPAQSVAIEGGPRYWCYEGDFFAVASDGMSWQEIQIRVAHFAEKEKASRRAADKRKAEELAVLAAEAERLRVEREEAYARSPEGIARAQAERARAEAERARKEAEARAVEEAKARKAAEERQRQEAAERLREEARRKEQERQQAEKERARQEEEARLDRENPGWREEKRKRELERKKRVLEEKRRKNLKQALYLFLVGPVPGILTAVALAIFGWPGAVVAVVISIILTAIVGMRIHGWLDWLGFVFVMLPCIVAAVLLVKIGFFVALGALVVYGVALHFLT